MRTRTGRTTAALAGVAVALLATACGTEVPGDAAGDRSAAAPADSVPGIRSAPATAVTSRGELLVVAMETGAGRAGCATRPRLRVDEGRRAVRVETLFHSATDRCPDQQTLWASARIDLRGRDLVVNDEAWRRDGVRTWVRCDGVLGCEPPRDRCDDAWVEELLGRTELPPERLVDTVACDGDRMVLHVRATSTGCVPLEGQPAPGGCDDQRVDRYWYLTLGEGRTWDVVDSSADLEPGWVDGGTPAG